MASSKSRSFIFGIRGWFQIGHWQLQVADGAGKPASREPAGGWGSKISISGVAQSARPMGTMDVIFSPYLPTKAKSNHELRFRTVRLHRRKIAS